MHRPFDLFIAEEFGANSIQRDTKNLVKSVSKDVHMGLSKPYTAQTAPSQWNNSPFSATGNTSAFGSNPKTKQKRKVLSFQEFMKVFTNRSPINNKKEKKHGKANK